MSNRNFIEKNPRHRHKGTMSARFHYLLSFCRKDWQCFHLNGRRKVRLWRDRNHNSHFCLFFAPVHCLSRYDFSPLVTQPTYSDFLSSLFVLSCVYVRHTFLTNPLRCSIRQGRENARTLWGDFGDG